jgi:RNA polymerase sigma-70 factor, ECF subfamily
VARPSEFIAPSCSCSRGEEKGLIRHARNGCVECKNQLIVGNADRLRSFVFRIKLASEDTEDIFQQTICRALTKFQQFRGDSSFLTWLCKIALNEIRQLMRNRQRRRLISLDEDLLNVTYLSESTASALEVLCRADTERTVRLAVEALPYPFRSVVELCDFEGLSLHDVAQRLHLTLPAVKSRHFRARHRLVQTIESHLPARRVSRRLK